MTPQGAPETKADHKWRAEIESRYPDIWKGTERTPDGDTIRWVLCMCIESADDAGPTDEWMIEAIAAIERFEWLAARHRQ